MANTFVKDNWGINGEKWTAYGPLGDYRMAGCMTVPILTKQVNVKDHGAIGDGVSDDTQAFLYAINQGAGTKIIIPAGRYKITKQLVVKVPNLVFEGADKTTTTLVFPKSLSAVGGDNGPWDSWSWGGGFIQYMGSNSGKQIASVTGPAKRGDKVLTVSDASQMRVGQMVRLILNDGNGALGKALLGGTAATPAELRNTKLVDYSFKITAISGNTISLDRPLRWDVNLAYKPVIYTDVPTVYNGGVSNLTFEFPEIPYPGHHDEPGFNAIALEKVQQIRLANLVIRNADSGIFLHNETKFVTVETVKWEGGPGRSRMGYGTDLGEPQNIPIFGHHGITLSGLCQDCLISDLWFPVRFIHEIGHENLSCGNVWRKVVGLDVVIDHHRRIPYENLYTNCDVGLGNRVWESGGDDVDGPPAGIHETYWNIKSAKPLAMPSEAIQWNNASTVDSGVSPDVYVGQIQMGNPVPPPPPTPVPPAPTPPPSPVPPVIDPVKLAEAQKASDTVQAFLKSLQP
jgi:hypothetical protein